MRIVIAAPPKSVTSWIRCLLGSIYDLAYLDGKQTPSLNDPESFGEWIAGGGFPDDTAFRQHLAYSDALADAVAAVPAHLVTLIRDPYDKFVSLYYSVQTKAKKPQPADEERGQDLPADEKQDRKRPAVVMAGKPIGHPDVLAYLGESFGRSLADDIAWIHSGRSLVLPYEEFHRDPHGTLSRLTEGIASVPAARIEDAIYACRAENMRRVREGRTNRVRTATVGVSRSYLDEAHLAIFRERHADAIRTLGYDVR